MKELQDLSEADFNKLKKSGLLKKIYPDAPNTYREIKGVRPKPKAKPDLASLVKMAEDYMDAIQNEGYMKDADNWFFEQVINCVYGKESGVWDFIRKNSR